MRDHKTLLKVRGFMVVNYYDRYLLVLIPLVSIDMFHSNVLIFVQNRSASIQPVIIFYRQQLLTAKYV